MALREDDLAILSARFGVARFGASRFGFYPDDVEGSGNDEPGEYVWKEDKPPTTLWTLQSLFSHCGERPEASFTDLPDPSDPDEEVQFTDTSTPQEYVSYWYWTFGDGNDSYDQNPTHAYTTPGAYTVTLYVSGVRGSASTTGSHTVVSDLAVTVDADPTSAQPYEDIDFTSIVTGGSAPYTYAWDFDDGAGTSEEANPTYQYTGDNTYTVELTVTDALLDTAQDTVVVVIATPP